MKVVVGKNGTLNKCVVRRIRSCETGCHHRLSEEKKVDAVARCSLPESKEHQRKDKRVSTEIYSCCSALGQKDQNAVENLPYTALVSEETKNDDI